MKREATSNYSGGVTIVMHSGSRPLSLFATTIY